MRSNSRNRLRAGRFLLPVVMALGAVGSTAVAAEPPPSSSMILQELRAFRECGSVLYIAAHPDDENTQFLAYMARGRGVRTGYLSLTRGEGGQDLIGPEIGDPLGVIRTQELLAARRIDGAEQFFTRARDFGFSKSCEQTLAKWGHQEVLSDVVRVIRQFRPDVIVTRFPPEPGGTHGHHTASTVLALGAFKLAGDPKAFPECGAAWQPKRIYWNSFRDARGSAPPLRLDIGGCLPLLGEYVGEIAARSRSSHRSQGYGTVAVRGSRLDNFQPLDGKPVPEDDLFDILDRGYFASKFDAGLPSRGPSQLPSDQAVYSESEKGTEIDALSGKALADFKPENPAEIVSLLFLIRNKVAALPSGPLRDTKLRQITTIIQHCLGLYVETEVAQAEVVPGEKIKMRHTIVYPAAHPARLLSISVPGVADKTDETPLTANQPVVRDLTWTVPANLPLSQPYWLRDDASPGLYSVADPQLIGQAEAPAAAQAKYIFDVLGERLEISTDVVQIFADPVRGESRRALLVIPPVSLTLVRDVQLFSPESDRTVEVEVNAYRLDQTGTLKLAAPAGWTVAPESQPFHLAAVGDHVRLAFTVHAPSLPGTAAITAEATVGGHTYNTTRQEIRYDHIPFQLLQPPARLKAVCLDLQIRGQNVGYLPGAGDKTVDALNAMGFHVTTLSGADLTPERLRSFDAVVVGVRAFNVRTDIAAGLNALFAYAENGGTVVEQYNTPNELNNPRLGPYPLELSRNLPQQRVTDENAPVTLLVPDHPAFNVPNRITPADFDGWVQERGLNFPVTWDQEHYQTLLACSDTGEAPLKSGLLVAHYGKGYFVYTGLSFFRQLPAGVPGAYRLFANLVSLGK